MLYHCLCVQELLKLFGIPYVESPSEAEAQCAMLETLNLTHGTITDDNDVLLFGGQHVYRFMFAKNRDPQKYSAVKMEDLLGELTLEVCLLKLVYQLQCTIILWLNRMLFKVCCWQCLKHRYEQK